MKSRLFKPREINPIKIGNEFICYKEVDGLPVGYKTKIIQIFEHNKVLIISNGFSYYNNVFPKHFKLLKKA